MAEVWFYHLERQAAADVLPGLLARGLERGMRMAVQTRDETQAKDLSQKLWAVEDVAFIAHGLAGDPSPELQPILLCSTTENPNNASYRFYINGAEPQSLEALSRAMIMFDGQDEAALQQAREMWRRFKSDGHAIKYWKQDDTGRWVDQAG